MSFRLRVTLLTATAVAVAAIGASIAMYFVVQDQLINQVDQNLQAAASTAARGGPRPGDRPGPFGPRDQLITHLVNHGTHHRAETGMLLERIGRSPGDMDYLYYCLRP